MPNLRLIFYFNGETAFSSSTCEGFGEITTDSISLRFKVMYKQITFFCIIIFSFALFIYLCNTGYGISLEPLLKS
jgi:hypothetical protein